MKKLIINVLVCISFNYASSQVNNLKIPVQTGEFWWSGIINEGHKMPFQLNTQYSINMYGNCKWNQAQPILLSNKGRYIWSESPFSFEIKKNTIQVKGRVKLSIGKAGNM